MEEDQVREALQWVVLPDGSRIHAPRIAVEDEESLGGDSANPQDKGFHLLEKVRSAWGSTAGAGSDFFHVYRKQRAREMNRLEKMDKDWAELEGAQAFQKQREARIKANLERQVKKTDKRRRRKVNRLIREANEKAVEREDARKGGEIQAKVQEPNKPAVPAEQDAKVLPEQAEESAAAPSTRETVLFPEPKPQIDGDAEKDDKVRVVDLEDDF